MSIANLQPVVTCTVTLLDWTSPRKQNITVPLMFRVAVNEYHWHSPVTLTKLAFGSPLPSIVVCMPVMLVFHDTGSSVTLQHLMYTIWPLCTQGSSRYRVTVHRQWANNDCIIYVHLYIVWSHQLYHTTSALIFTLVFCASVNIMPVVLYISATYNINYV